MLRRRPTPSASGPAAAPPDLDVLYVTDLRFPGGTSSSLVHEIRAAAAAGYAIGILPLAATSIRGDRPAHPGLRSLLDEGAARLVVPGAVVTATLAIVKHPAVLAEPLGGRLPVTTDRVVVVVGQTPVDPDGTQHYDLATVRDAAVEAFGSSPTFTPVSPTIRQVLDRQVLDRGAPERSADRLEIDDDDDWVEVIDPSEWTVDRSHRLGATPVIGRHSRPDPSKWPATAEELLAAYPDDGTAVVRILGGAPGADDLLGSVPDSWDVLPFGSTSPRDFLASIDFFVYFHHPSMLEAFGRTTLEALASGAVCIVPAHFEPVFDDACVYAEPAGVRGIVERFHSDEAAYASQSARAVAVVADRFSYAHHVRRIERLIGPPRVGAASSRSSTPREWVDVPPRVAAQMPTVVVACLGASAREATRVVRAVARQRDHAAGFRPVVVGTVRAPEAAAELGVQFEVVTSRQNFSGPDEMWPEYAQRRLRGIVREVGASNVTVADLTHPDAWIALRVAPHGRSAPVDDPSVG